jgi:hypothetical protein
VKNYILLGIGIGMIISGTIFTFFDNKEYSKLEDKIREEVIKEMSKEKIFDDIEEEFSSIVEDKKVELEEKKVEDIKVKKLENEKVEAVESKEEKNIEIKKNEDENEQEVKIELAKFYPLPDGENIYNIQFRSSSDKEEVLRVQKILSPVIDTKIEFIQGYYRLFAKDLYSEEYAEMMVHEIKKAFSLNPIIRSPKQLDYLVLGPKKYNEKYNIELTKKEEINDKNKNVEKEMISNEDTEEEEKEISKEEIKEQVSLKEEKEEENIEKISTNTQVKENEIEDKSQEDKNSQEITSENKLGQDTLAVDSVDSVEKVDIKKVEEVEEIAMENKNTKLIFVENGSKNQMEFIKTNIEELMELEIKEEDGKYKVESKDYFSEVVADDIVSKLNLLFNLDIKRDKK